MGDNGSTDREYKFLQYETHDDGQIVRILLDRPDAKNAQNRGMLVELDEAFLHAEADDQVRVVILGGEGLMFSSGHDMGSKVAMDEYAERHAGMGPLTPATPPPGAADRTA